MRFLLLFALIHQCLGTRLEAVPDRAAMHYVHSENSLLLLRNSACRGIGLQYTNGTWLEDPKLVYETSLVINNLFMAYYEKRGGMDCPETGSSFTARVIKESRVATAVVKFTQERPISILATTTVTPKKETMAMRATRERAVLP